jgi:broad specificity phosphatase PhoE
MATLIRHAQTVLDPATPSHEWPLSDEGRAAARALALSGPALSSSEQKALDTARLAGLDPKPDDRLREARRPFVAEYEPAVARYLGGEPLDGWEPRDDVLARMRAALDGYDGVAVTHGLAIAIYAGMTFDEWRAMPFPAVIEC